VGYIWDYFIHKKGTKPKMRQEMSENLKILENGGEKVRLLGIDTCLSLNEIMDIRCINVRFSWFLNFRSFFPVSSNNKSKRHYITEMLLKMALNTITIALKIRQHDSSTQHYGVKAKTGWLGIRIICQRWGSYLQRTVVSVTDSTINIKLIVLV